MKQTSLYYEKVRPRRTLQHNDRQDLCGNQGKDYKRVSAIGGGSVVDVAKVLVFAGAEKAIDLLG